MVVACFMVSAISREGKGAICVSCCFRMCKGNSTAQAARIGLEDPGCAEIRAGESSQVSGLIILSDFPLSGPWGGNLNHYSGFRRNGGVKRISWLWYRMIQVCLYSCNLKIVVLLDTLAIPTSLANGILCNLTGRMGALRSQPFLEGCPLHTVAPAEVPWETPLSAALMMLFEVK